VKKLHLSYFPKSAHVRVQVCELVEHARGRELLSSTDGAVAIEIHRPAEAKATRWKVIGEHRFACTLVMPWQPDEVARIAMQIWEGIGRPEVAAIALAPEFTLVRTMNQTTGERAWMLRALADHETYLADAPFVIN